MSNCNNFQKSLDWCMGTPELPGIKKRLFYISKNSIVKWPQYPRNNNGSISGSLLQGRFVLKADAFWNHIIILAEKSQLTSEAQGEIPSQTQLNKLVAVHPGIGPEATALSAYVANSDNVYIVEDMKGRFRVVGSEKWPTKSAVSQDLGQGPTGSTSTTLTVEASDESVSPFYDNDIVTSDGLAGELRRIYFDKSGACTEQVSLTVFRPVKLDIPLIHNGIAYSYGFNFIGLDECISFSIPSRKRVTIYMAPGDKYQTINVDGIRRDGNDNLSLLDYNEGPKVSVVLNAGEHTITKFIGVKVVLVTIEDA